MFWNISRTVVIININQDTHFLPNYTKNMKNLTVAQKIGEKIEEPPGIYAAVTMWKKYEKEIIWGTVFSVTLEEKNYLHSILFIIVQTVPKFWVPILEMSYFFFFRLDWKLGRINSRLLKFEISLKINEHFDGEPISEGVSINNRKYIKITFIFLNKN